MSEPSPPDSRDRIVRTALKLFCDKGYGAVGTAELCAAAGVLKGTLYHFFPSKLDVALAALHAYGEGFRREVVALAGAELSASDKVLALFAQARDQARSDVARSGTVHGCLHGNLALELAAADPRARQALDEVAAGWVAALVPILAELQAEGRLAPGDDLERAARAVIAYLHGVVLMAKTANDPAVIDQLAGRVFALLGGPG